MEDKKSSENGLITAVTFHWQPRGLAVGLKDSPSLPPLLPSAMSHLRFTASAVQLLEPTGHGGKLEIPGLAQNGLETLGAKQRLRVKGYVRRG